MRHRFKLTFEASGPVDMLTFPIEEFLTAGFAATLPGVVPVGLATVDITQVASRRRKCPDCPRREPHVHCPECGAIDHAAANCPMEG